MKILERLATLVLAGVIFSSAYAQSPEEAAYSHKLGYPEIWENASAGKVQNLLVNFDAGQLEKEVAKERVAITAAAEQRKQAANLSRQSIDAIDEDARAKDEAVRGKLVSKLHAIKEAVFPRGGIPGAKIIRDFPHSATVLVEVRSLDALKAILSMPSVTMVNIDAPIKPAANWPASYGDITIIKSHVTDGVEGRRGKDTRVVVLDTAAYLASLPGWSRDKKPACLPYLDGKFKEEQLGMGKTSASENCRVWSAYNFSNSNVLDYCASPYYAQTYDRAECWGGQWQHGTLVAHVVANTAPGAWLTMLQVYSDGGSSTTSYVLSALDWLIQHSQESPRIVAANISFNEVGRKYTSYCPTAQLAPKISSLLDYGIVPVVATGNDGWTDGVASPACVEGVIAVGATTDSYASARKYEGCTDPTFGADVVPCFSNTHSTMLSMFAPGVDIGSSDPIVAGKSESILKASGTSFAAPHVAGAVAILRATDALGTAKSAAQIRDILIKNGTNITDRRQFDVSKKRLDIAKAMHYVTKLSVTPATARIDRGKTLQLSVQATDSFGSTVASPDLTFYSLNSQIASIDTKGLVTGTGAGTTIVRAVAPAATAQSSIEVIGKVDPPTDPCKVDPRRCQRQSN